MSTTHVHYMELVVNARIHFLRLPIEIPVLFVSVALNESFNQNGYPAGEYLTINHYSVPSSVLNMADMRLILSEPFLAPAIQQEIALLSDSYRAEQDGIAASTADQTVWLTARTQSIAAVSDTAGSTAQKLTSTHLDRPSYS